MSKIADIIIDGRVKVWEVQTIADISAPTVAELDAGQQLEDIMTPDGLVGFEPDTADVDNSSLDSTFDTVLAGRASFSGTMLRIKKQSQTGDTVHDLLVRDYSTHIAVRTGVTADTAWTAAQEVRIYPIICGEVRHMPPEANTVERYEVPVKIRQEPDLRAIVAA